MTDDELFMTEALNQAAAARDEDEVPVGAVIVKDGRIIALAHNQREKSGDPTAHAEMTAIRRAAEVLGGWRLTDCTLYVTLEPCPMCAGACINARVKRIVFGASDNKAGCCATLYELPKDTRFNHRVEVEGGVLGQQCGQMLSDYFKMKRSKPV